MAGPSYSDYYSAGIWDAEQAFTPKELPHYRRLVRQARQGLPGLTRVLERLIRRDLPDIEAWKAQTEEINPDLELRRMYDFWAEGFIAKATTMTMESFEGRS